MPTSKMEIEFCALLNRHNAIINNICHRCCKGDSFYYDELRQECIVELWAEYSRYKLDRFRGDSVESTWIYSICYHAIAHYFRNPRNAKIHFFCNENELATLLNTEVSDDWCLLDELTQQLLPHERSILNLYLDDESYATIARKENITENTARKRMSRLIERLKKIVR